jgi:hypothetical protein
MTAVPVRSGAPQLLTLSVGDRQQRQGGEGVGKLAPADVRVKALAAVAPGVGREHGVRVPDEHPPRRPRP